MKVRSAVRRLCRDCYVIKKKKVVYIRCKTVKKHKQRQGFHTEAGVLALEEWGHPHGAGGARASEVLAVGSWTASAENYAGNGKSPAEIMSALPWLPSWASTPSSSSTSPSFSGNATIWPASRTLETPALAAGPGVPGSSELSSERRPVVAGVFSPLRAVGAWGAALFGRARGAFWP